MKHIAIPCVLAVLPVAAPALAQPAADAKAEPACSELDENALLDRVDDVYRGTSSEGEVTMKVVTEHYTREMTMKMWTRGTKRSLIRIVAPKKEKGTATLMVDDNVWNYLPKVKRVIKVPSSMMGGAWMGSHFTNDDLVKQNRMSEDFTFEKTFEGKRDGRDVIELTCTPKEEAAIVWGKVVVELDVGICLPVSQQFYDEDGRLVRTMTYSDMKTIGTRTLPTTMRVVPVDKPKELTEVRWGDIRFDADVKDSMFTLRSLQR